jgi:hypothetical protein
MHIQRPAWCTGLLVLPFAVATAVILATTACILIYLISNDNRQAYDGAIRKRGQSYRSRGTVLIEFHQFGR